MLKNPKVAAALAILALVSAALLVASVILTTPSIA